MKVANFSDLDLTKEYTVADYLTWWFEERVELIKGKIHPLIPTPRDIHQEVSINLSTEINSRLKKHPCAARHAPYDVFLPIVNKKGEPHTVVQPDLVVICDLDKIKTDGCHGAPDLVVEILSPGTSKKDTNEKFDLYEETGVKEYWIVHPSEQTFQVYVLVEGSYQLKGRFFGRGDHLESTAVDGLVLDLNEVFEETR